MSDITTSEDTRLPWGRRATVDDCLYLVLGYYGLTANHMRGLTRATEISHPRMIAMALARQYTDASFPRIGNQIGGCRDHTTVIHAVRRVREWEFNRPEIAADLAELHRRMKERLACGILDLGLKDGLKKLAAPAQPAPAPQPRRELGPIPRLTEMQKFRVAGTGKDAADAFARTVPFEPRGMGA